MSIDPAVFRRTFRFSDFVLDADSRQLRRGGVPVEVPRRVFDVLLYLLEHRERAIGRDELIRHVWGRDNVSDNQLAHTVLAARRAVDDDGSSQRLIRTVAGFGYHWVGAVEPVQALDDAEPVAGARSVAPSAEDEVDSTGVDAVAAAPSREGLAAAPPARTPSSRHRLLGPGLLVLLLGVFAMVLWRGDPEPAPVVPLETGEATRIWILPAEVADEPDTGWARVGLMALVGEQLRRSGLVVVPVENVLTRIGGDTGAEDAAARLRREVRDDVIIEAAATRDRDDWEVTLKADGLDGEQRFAHGRHADLLVAARIAAWAMAPQVGGEPPADNGHPDIRLELVRQAISSNDFDGARAQLARLPADLRSDAGAALIEVELALAMGRLGQAQSKIAPLLDSHRQLAPELHGRVLVVGAELARRLNDPDWARHVDDAVTVLETAAAPRALAFAMQARGTREVLADRYENAASDYLRARRLFLDAGDELGAATADANLARLAMRVGRPDDALDQLSRSASVYRRYGAVSKEFNALTSMMSVQQGVLRWQDMLATDQRARKLLPEVTDPTARSLYLLRRVTVMTQLGRLAEAHAALDDLAQEVQRGELGAETRAMEELLRAELLMAGGRAGDAIAPAAAAFATFHARHPAPGGGSSQRTDARDLALAVWLRASLQEPGASVELDAAQQAVIDHAERTYALIARGLWLRETDRADEARVALRRALDAAIESNRLARMLHASVPLIDLLLAEQRIDEADALLDRLHSRNPGVVEQDYSAALLSLSIRHARGDHGPWQQALEHAQRLAGERPLPAHLRVEP